MHEIIENRYENEQYFLHSDHLGSSSWITDINGDVNQHLQNLPFGETFVDQRRTGHDVRFKFTGKERDSETGFDYFGARYYQSDLSVWLSVDPLSDMYPSTSPYMYVAGNPIMLIDPDGQKFINFDKNGNYTNTTKDNMWHNFWHGSKGRIMNDDGSVKKNFKFADPKNDVADIESGKINKVVIVNEKQIQQLLKNAGAFNQANRDKPADYLLAEGKGGGKFDFSYNGIPGMFSDASSHPLKKPSKALFLVDGEAKTAIKILKQAKRLSKKK